MAASEAERVAIRAQIESLLSKQAERETAALRERAERMRETLVEQCRQRPMRLFGPNHKMPQTTIREETGPE